MKFKNIILSLLVVIGLVFSNLSFVSAIDGEDGIMALDLDAKFKTITSGEVEGLNTDVYAYVASELYDPTPMMTPVIFVWNNGGYVDENDAWNTAVKSGLIEVAEQSKGCVLFVDQVDEGSWGQKDVDVYKWLQDAIVTDKLGLGFTTYDNLIYAVGEGDGATFVNNYMSQNANRIGAALLFGGTINYNQPNKMSLPAYLVGAEDKVVDFYKTINHTDTESAVAGNVAYINSNLTTERVVVNKTETNSFDSAIVKDAWNSMMKRITRNVMGRCVWAQAYGMASGGSKEPVDEIFTLMDRPVYDEIGLVFNEEVTGAAYPRSWNEWIPEEALDAKNTDTYPLVMVFHGSGDHPIFEAESNGWVKLAGEERLIIVSVEWQNGPVTDPDTPINAEATKSLIDYICKTYPVDTSRIYATGFSAGSGQTLTVANAYKELFAGIAPVSMPPFGTLNVTDEEAKNIDLPVFLGTGTQDMYNTSGSPESGFTLGNARITGILNPAFTLNNINYQIDAENRDFDVYPFYGYDITKNASSSSTYVSAHGFKMETTGYANDKGIELVRFMTIEGMEHNHYTEYAPNIWNFFKNFSRNTETGELVYTNNTSPEEPVEPTEPTKPVEPADSTKPTVSSPNETTKPQANTNVKTGDETHLMGYATVFMLSAIGLLLLKKKKAIK